MATKFKKNLLTDAGVKKRSPRQLRVGEEIRHALAAALQTGDYPWPDDLPRTSITVTEVQVSPDLRNATAFIMPLRGERVEAVVQALKIHSYFFKKIIARDVQLRYVPALFFAADTSFAYAEKIEKLLHTPAVARDLSGNATPPDGQDGDNA